MRTGKSPPAGCGVRQPSSSCETEPHGVPELDSLAGPKGGGAQETRCVESAARWVYESDEGDLPTEHSGCRVFSSPISAVRIVETLQTGTMSCVRGI